MFARWMKAHDLLAFFVLTFLITFAAWIPMALTLPQKDIQYMSGGGYLLMLLGLWGPALAAILTTAVTRGKRGLKELLGRLLMWRVSIKWFLVAALGFPAFIFLAALVYAFVTHQPVRLNWSSLSMILALPFSSLLFQGYYANEEIGWRGFALPRMLGRWNALFSSILLGILWGAWHIPYLWGIKGVSLPWPFSTFLLFIVSISILMTWIFYHTRGSLLIALLFHIWVNNIPGYVTAFLSIKNTNGFNALLPWLYAAAALLVVAMYGYRTLTRRGEATQPLEMQTKSRIGD
jgi:membrane protease YdiL (CAAX protease family)